MEYKYQVSIEYEEWWQLIMKTSLISYEIYI